MPGWKPLLLLVAAAVVLMFLLGRTTPDARQRASMPKATVASAERAVVEPEPPVSIPVRPDPPPLRRQAEVESAFDAHGEPTLGFFRDAIETALRERLPGLKLSPADVDRLARAARRLRASQEALRQLPVSPEVADRRRALTEAVAQAGAVFHEVTGLSSSEFTEAVAPEDGLDEFDPDEPIPAGEYLEPRP